VVGGVDNTPIGRASCIVELVEPGFLNGNDILFLRVCSVNDVLLGIA